MNPFTILSAVQQDYLTYVRAFQRFRDGSLRCDMYEISVGLQCSPGPPQSGNALPDMGKRRLFGGKRHIRGTNATQKGKQGVATAHE